MHKRFMRRVIFLLTAVLMISCGSLVYAGTVESSGTCGENATWTLDSEGVLTVNGDGEMGAFDSTFRPYKVKKAVIVEGIESVYLSGCFNMTEVTLAESVMSIEGEAFYDCRSLTSITIPDSVNSIGSQAFSGCDSLTSISIPNGVSSISFAAFEGCSNLTSITIPDSVTSIGGYAFNGCSSLTSITIPDNVESIGKATFSGCSSLTSVTIPDNVTSIGDSVFYGCSSLTSITIPDSVTSIKDWMFKDCSSLTSITIPDSVSSIGYSAFEGCSNLTSIIIPDSVPSISAQTFAYCDSLTSITIPDSVSSIGYSAFEGCSNLTSITIPDSVTSVEELVFSLNGRDSYNGKLVINGNAGSYIHKYAKSLGIQFCCFLHSYGKNYIYICDECGFINETLLPPGIVDGGKCGENIEWTLNSEGLLTIRGAGDMQSFDYERTDVKKVVVSDGVASIGAYAFMDCSSLTTIALPDSVTSIGTSAFKGCSNLTSITIPDSVTSIGYSAFEGCSNLTSIIIPDSVTSIGAYAFMDCSSLTTIALPDSVTSIEQYTFKDCSSLTSITIPDSVTSIGVMAFAYCDSLSSLVIPDNVTSIGRSYEEGDGWYYGEVFFGCDELTIYGSVNSCAYEHAKEYRIPFTCVSHENIITLPGSNPSCTKIGWTEGKKCEDCGTITVEQTRIPANKHSYGNDYICDNCGFENEALKPTPTPASCTHAWKAATCTTAKICTKCKIIEGNALGHEPGAAQVTVKATTTKNGKIETKCTRCSTVLETATIKKASKVNLSAAAYTYNGKMKSPTVVVKDSAGKTISSKYYTVSKPSGRNAIGKYTYTVKFKGNYSGTKKLTLTIKPVKPTIQTPTAAKKAITVKWKKGSKTQVTGYEVMVATNSKFSKNKKTATVKGYSKTSYKMTKLKAKTKYYVKVRTFKTVKGVKIYSDWSKVKTIKTK